MLPEPTLKTLRERARKLNEARLFFAERNILEVDCCALNPCAAIDTHIDVIDAAITSYQKGFLHTSPEYAMKRLLCRGIGDIYFLGHVFRQGDIGRLHNPEFTMVEWYRTEMPFSAMIEETCDFLRLFLGSLPSRSIGYREALLQYAGIDIRSASLNDLQKASQRFSIEGSLHWSLETYIHCLLTHAVEPHLGRGELTVFTEYPPEEAALARVVEKEGHFVAQRFEIYCEGIELANGYCELGHSIELRRRFTEQNTIRKSLGKATYPLDESFLTAMENNFPECCGVSVGFDRALMLQLKAQAISEVLPFAWPS